MSMACADGTQEPLLNTSQVKIALEGVKSASASADEYPVLGDSDFYIRCVEGACTMGSDPARTDLPPEIAIARGTRISKPTLADLQVKDYDSNRFATDETLTVARQREEIDSRSTVTFALWLWEDEYDYQDLRGALDDTDRAAAIERRRAMVQPEQEQVIAHVQQHGGRIISRFWLTNKLGVQATAGQVASIVDHPLVYAAYLDDDSVSDAGGDGLDRKDALTIVAPNQDGDSGSRAGVRINIAIIEDNNQFNAGHVAWNDTSGGGFQRDSTTACTSAGCSGTSTTTTGTHGTAVAAVAAGGILEGQDSAYAGSYTNAQWERSGLANESRVSYYDANQTGTSLDLAKAIEAAVGGGADVINMSWSVGSSVCANLCSTTYDSSGINAELFEAEDLGVVLVKSAGNFAVSCPTTPCTTGFPASHPDVLSVGALADTDGAPTFLNVGLLSNSSRGYRSVTLLGGAAANVPTVGLVGLGVVRSYVKDGTSGAASYSTGTYTGTSFSTPQISSLAAMFREWMSDNGMAHALTSWGVAINLLLMGDGRCGVGCQSFTQVDDDYGYGFPRYVVPDTTHLGSTAMWGWRTFTITQGSTVKWTVNTSAAEPTSINGWKWVLALDTGYTNLPDLNVRVVNNCDGGVLGVTATVATAAKQGSRYRIILNDAPNQIHNKCLEMWVTGNNVAVGGETIWSADYYFSNTKSFHVYQ